MLEDGWISSKYLRIKHSYSYYYYYYSYNYYFLNTKFNKETFYEPWTVDWNYSEERNMA